MISKVVDIRLVGHIDVSQFIIGYLVVACSKDRVSLSNTYNQIRIIRGSNEVHLIAIQTMLAKPQKNDLKTRKKTEK